MIRIGQGYDVHRLVKERKLILGGVEIPYEKGLFGHSDADVLIHAMMDSLLGAAGEGDIGKHFPDTSEQYKNISSLTLLGTTNRILMDKGYKINNIDSTIVAQRPRLTPFIPEMKDNITSVLGLSPSSVNVKATTTEGLGFTGVGEGIAAYAVTLISQRN